MQTYAHLAVGGFVGGLLFPHEPTSMALCCAGAVAPDAITAVLYTAEAIKRKPLKLNLRILLPIMAVSHSLLLQMILMISGFFLREYVGNVILAFSIGAASHQLFDAATHVDARYYATDSGYLWPLRWRLQSIIGWRDYRCTPFSIFRLKRFEQIILLLALTGIIMLLL